MWAAALLVMIVGLGFFGWGLLMLCDPEGRGGRRALRYLVGGAITASGGVGSLVYLAIHALGQSRGWW